MDFLQVRREWAAEFGAVVFDSALGRAGNVISNANPLYRDLASLLKTAAGILTSLDPTAQYCSFHSGRGVDLVVTLEAGEPVARWDGTGAPVRALTAAETRVLAEDAALRNIAGTSESQGFEAAWPAIDHAIEIAPLRRELIGYAERLVRVGKNSIAGKIVDARLAADADDIAALILDAQMTMSLVNSQQIARDSLATAEAQLARVLALEPGNLRARMMWCDLPRFAGDAPTSTRRFLELLERHPEAAPAHYNLGAIYLAASDPERALHHFTAGERLAPTDADYPIGRVRSLLALGRTDDARRALALATELAPDHRMIPTLRQQL